MRKYLVIGLLIVVGMLLFYTIGKMPPMNSKKNPDKTNVMPRYVNKGLEESGAENVVTNIILNYRGYDTMGEVTVIFSALCAVVALLDREKRRRSRSAPDASPVKASVIVKTVARFTVPLIVFFAICIMLHGENSPGGGFQGGAVIGASIILFSLAFTLPRSTDRMPLKGRIPLESVAMLGFLSMGFLGLAFGVNFLTYLLPGVPASWHHLVRSLMMTVIEVGIGVAGGTIFVSIVFMLSREDRYELQPDGD